MRILLVRHGATLWSANGRHTGRTDLPLTPEGEEEARALAPLLKEFRPAAVFSSPLERARRTAELAGFSAEVRTDPDLMEWNYGLYEGRTAVEIHKERPAWDLFRDGVPEGESLDDVVRRVTRVLDRLRTIEGDILLFAHSHVLRVLVATWLALPPDTGRHFVLDTGSLSILGREHLCPALLSLNTRPSPPNDKESCP